MFTSRMRIAAIGLVAASAIGVLGTGPAHAKDGDVVRRGDCSARSDWKLKLGPRDGRIETEFEVDSNRVNQRWHVTITHNGTTVVDRNFRTLEPSGSFEARARVPNAAGTDVVAATATNTRTGETCTAQASV